MHSIVVKMKQHKPYTSYNPYFIIPYIIWIIVGGIALLVSDKQTLFATFNTHHSDFGDTLMLAVTHMGEGWFISIVLLMMLGFRQLRNWWYFTVAILAGIIPSLITQVIKSAASAPRPLKYFNEAEWIHTLPQWPRLMERSFPSGHSCGTFSMFCLLALLLPPKYRPLGLLFLVCALAVGYSRMYLAAHFFEDVYVGSIIGGCFSILTIAIMNRYQRSFFKNIE